MIWKRENDVKKREKWKYNIIVKVTQRAKGKNDKKSEIKNIKIHKYKNTKKNEIRQKKTEKIREK